MWARKICSRMAPLWFLVETHFKMRFPFAITLLYLSSLSKSHICTALSSILKGWRVGIGFETEWSLSQTKNFEKENSLLTNCHTIDQAFIGAKPFRWINDNVEMFWRQQILSPDYRLKRAKHVLFLWPHVAGSCNEIWRRNSCCPQEVKLTHSFPCSKLLSRKFYMSKSVKTFSTIRNDTDELGRRWQIYFSDLSYGNKSSHVECSPTGNTSSEKRGEVTNVPFVSATDFQKLLNDAFQDKSDSFYKAWELEIETEEWGASSKQNGEIDV